MFSTSSLIIHCSSFMQTMKQEHSQLSREAHECADSIPELNQMVVAVQALGNFKRHFILLLVLEFMHDSSEWNYGQLHSVRISK